MMVQRPSFSSHPGEHLKGVSPPHLLQALPYGRKSLETSQAWDYILSLLLGRHVTSDKLLNVQEFHVLYWQNGQGHRYQMRLARLTRDKECMDLICSHMAAW